MLRLMLPVTSMVVAKVEVVAKLKEEERGCDSTIEWLRIQIRIPFAEYRKERSVVTL